MKGIEIIHQQGHLLLQTFRVFYAKRGNLYVSSLTISTLLALVPLLALGALLVSWVPQVQQSALDMQNQLFLYLLPDTAPIIDLWVREFLKSVRSMTWPGVAILAVAVMNLMLRVEISMRDLVDWHPVRFKVKRSLIYSLLFVLYFLVLSLFLLGSVLFHSLSWLSQVHLSPGWGSLFISLLLWAMVFGLYRFVPAYPHHIRALIYSGLFTVLFFIYQKAFSWVFTLFPNVHFIYGAFAVLPLTLFWLTLNWTSFLLLFIRMRSTELKR